MASSESSAVFYSDERYEIRPAENTEEFKSMWWAFMQGLGWNRCYYDLETYMNPSYSSGMILLIDKTTNKPCGHVSAVVNSNKTGWVSMFIIDEAYRGHGLGRPLFKAAMEDFKRAGTQITGLDGVLEQKGTYERRGFVDSPLGTINIMVRPLIAKEPLPETAELRQGSKLVDIRKVPYGLLTAHETTYTGFERPKLWSDEHMFHRPDVSGFAYISGSSPPRSVHDLHAWVLVRRCSGGLRLGPLYAHDEASAQIVLEAAMKAGTSGTIKRVPLPNEPMSSRSQQEIEEKATLVTEVWGGNQDAVKLFENLGWKDAGVSYHRMWVNGKATPEQSKGGAAQKGLYAIFDAAVG